MNIEVLINDFCLKKPRLCPFSRLTAFQWPAAPTITITCWTTIIIITHRHSYHHTRITSAASIQITTDRVPASSASTRWSSQTTWKTVNTWWSCATSNWRCRTTSMALECRRPRRPQLNRCWRHLSVPVLSHKCGPRSLSLNIITLLNAQNAISVKKRICEWIYIWMYYCIVCVCYVCKL